jgi:flagellin
MGLRINNSTAASTAQRQVTKSSQATQKSLQRLSSGLRINQAADDAAGLAVSERFRTRIREQNTQIQNLQTGVNVVSTADGALQSQGEAIGRIRELAVSAASGTLSPEDRTALNKEAQQLLEQVDKTSQDTEFNGQKLLNGSSGTIQLGAGGGGQVNINASTANSLGLNGLDLTTQAGAQAALDKLDTAAGNIDQNRAGLGAQQNRFETAIRGREIEVENTSAAESRLRDLDVAQETLKNTRSKMLLQMGTSMMAQANTTAQMAGQLLGR